MAEERRCCLASPLGPLLLAEDGTGMTRVRLLHAALEDGEESPLLREAAAQLRAYFAGRLRVFDLPLHPAGTPFQLRVWEVLRGIPYGETRSYKETALLAGSPRGFRAVGMANHNNPLLILIPCHRVIAADGSLRGFACGLDCKRLLLRLERENLQKSIVKSV